MGMNVYMKLRQDLSLWKFADGVDEFLTEFEF